LLAFLSGGLALAASCLMSASVCSLVRGIDSRAVADHGHEGGRTIRTEKLEKRLAALFEQGLGRRTRCSRRRRGGEYGAVQSMHARAPAERGAWARHRWRRSNCHSRPRTMPRNSDRADRYD
jgi:hypothetical protein